MKLLSLLSKVFGFDPPKQPTVSQVGAQAIAIRHLIANGSITARDILRHTNDAYKMVYRLRELGLLYALGHPTGEQMAPSRKKGGSPHKVYKWTGKLPANWPDKR